MKFKGKSTKQEALLRGKKAYRKEELEPDAFYLVVDPEDTGDMEINVQDGQIFFGPFDSPEAAYDAAGTDDADVVPGGDEDAVQAAEDGMGDAGDLPLDEAAGFVSDEGALVGAAKAYFNRVGMQVDDADIEEYLASADMTAAKDAFDAAKDGKLVVAVGPAIAWTSKNGKNFVMDKEGDTSAEITDAELSAALALGSAEGLTIGGEDDMGYEAMIGESTKKITPRKPKQEGKKPAPRRAGTKIESAQMKALRTRVLRDIQKEAEELDVDTTAATGDASTTDASGAYNSGVGSNVNQTPGEAGQQHEQDTGSSQEPSFTGSDGAVKPSGAGTLDANGGDLGSVTEATNPKYCTPGSFVRVYEGHGQGRKKVDQGIVKKMSNTSITLEGDEEYDVKKYSFIQLAH
jgi:hypothetical protein